MIGDDVALDASKLVRSYNNSTAINKKAYNIILIEKPVSILSGNNNSSATTTDTQK
jgi:hypothetical protein